MTEGSEAPERTSMKRTFLLLLLGLVLIAATAHLTRPSKPEVSSLAAVHTSLPITTHKIEFVGLAIDPSHCSATAIGPHAVLTASHCEEATDDLVIDQTKVKIVSILRDKLDHSIILFNGPRFTAWSELKAVRLQPLQQLIICGNPLQLTQLYRTGFVAGQTLGPTGIPVILIDMNVYYGDSGAGVFTTSGDLIGVLNIVFGNQRNGNYFKLAGMNVNAFTDAQLKQAREF